MGEGFLVKEGTGEKKGALDMLTSHPNGEIPSTCHPIHGQNYLKMGRP